MGIVEQETLTAVRAASDALIELSLARPEWLYLIDSAMNPLGALEDLLDGGQNLEDALWTLKQQMDALNEE